MHGANVHPTSAESKLDLSLSRWPPVLPASEFNPCALHKDYMRQCFFKDFFPPVLREVRDIAHPSFGLGAKESSSGLSDQAGDPTWVPGRGGRDCQGALKSVSVRTAIPGLAEVQPGLVKLQSSFYYLACTKHLQTSTDIVGVHRAFLFLPFVTDGLGLGEIQHRTG